MTDTEILEAMRTMIAPLGEGINRLEGRMDRLETQMDRIEGRMDQMETRMDRIEGRMDQMETRMGQMETRMGQMETRMDRIEGRMDQMETRIDRIESDVSGIKVIIDTEIRQELNLLAENQEIIMERLPDPAEAEALEARVSAIEAVMRQHSKELQKLKKAQ